MAPVKSLSDLNKDSVEKILQDFYKDPNLKVTQASGQERFLGDNENFASDIKSWTVTISQNGSERHVSFVIKTTNESAIFKRFSVLLRPFAKEIFWFKRAHPTLAKICPEIEDITPVCFYGYSNYDKLFVAKNVIDNSRLVILKMFTKKPEVGLILLHNLSFGDRPMKMLDKSKLMTADQVRVVFQTLARLHGSWLKWQHVAGKDGGPPNGIRASDVKALYMKMQPWMLKSTMDKTKRAFSKLLRQQGQDQVAARWETYAKDKMADCVMDIFDAKAEMKRSKIVTLCHGDTWTNNLMFSDDESRVVLLDYQLMAILHPAKDLWYFLAATTDAEFRKAHLSGLLKDYFEVFSGYLKDANIPMTLQEFESEIEARRDLLLLYAPDLIPMFLATEKLELTTWRSFKELEKKREQDIASEPRPDDPPHLIEIRRRLTGMLLEAAELNFF